MSNNSTVATVATGTNAEPTVKQGPEWLADLFVDPPAWLPPLVIAAILVVGVVVLAALVSVVRDLEESERVELAVEYAELLVIIGSIALVAKGLVGFAPLPYWADVLGGVTLGFAAAKVVCREITEERVAVAIERAGEAGAE